MKTTDRHRKGYYAAYHKKVVEIAIQKYGDQCSCKHCVIPKGHRPLILVLLVNKKIIGQYNIALYLKHNNYNKQLAKVSCLDCYPVCRHDYRKLFKKGEIK